MKQECDEDIKWSDPCLIPLLM